MSEASKRLEKAEKYLQKGKMEDALQEFQHALADEPDNNTIRERAADLCISLNKSKPAAILLSELFDRQAAINDQVKATITYKKLARVSSPSVEHTFRYAQFIEKSNKKEALELFERAAEGFASNDKKEDALEVWKHIVTVEPSFANFKRQGELATDLGDAKCAA